MRLNLTAAHDHILALTKFRTPIVAIEELIWNSLDADADEVRIELSYTTMGGLQRLRVTDNGHGISESQCKAAFGTIGGSSKLQIGTTPRGRRPHGKMGRGRLKAFGLGRIVRWDSRFESEGKLFGLSITGNRATINNFEVSETSLLSEGKPGVTVEITGFDSSPASLTDAEKAAKDLSHRLALYLSQYPGIKINYDEVLVDATSGQSHRQDYPVEICLPSHDVFRATLTVIEWDHATDRALYLCDREGFARDERPPGIKAKGWEFTAYLKSDLVEALDDAGALAMDEIHPTMKAVIDASKDALKTHFRKRESQRATELVQQWQDENVYPYDNLPADPVKMAEREVFDVCAVNVNEFLPNFDSLDRKNKRFTFRLLKQSLESNPSDLQTILREVLSLPIEKQHEFAQLLERTKLSSLINASKIVIDRLRVLSSLSDFLFGPLHKEVNEPRQLHPIMTQEMWLFGEQYLVGIDEESLTTLLRTHLSLLGRNELVLEDPTVTDFEGRERYLDLMLHRRYPTNIEGHFEHLVVEFKRPSLALGREEISQIENYAFKVANDPRFDKECTQWTFLLIGNRLDDFAKEKCTAPDRRFGHIHTGKVNIHVRPWSTLLSDANWRYEFFRKELDFQATKTESVGLLRKKHAQYFPEKPIPRASSKAGNARSPSVKPKRKSAS